jgi:DNA-binding transcriptional LysR family regulator
VLADMGVAIASEWMFTPELASGAVKRVLADWELPGIDLWAVFPSGRMASAKARAFVAWIEEMFAPQIEALPIEAPPSTNNV